jgi:hypothetical protein
VTTDRFASDVAKEFGFTFKQLKDECRLRGHSVSSANAVLPEPLVDWLRRELAPGSRQQDPSATGTGVEAADGQQEWERAVTRARRRTRQLARDQAPKYTRRHPPPRLIQAALDHAVVPRRSRQTQRPADVWTVEEVDRAERIAGAFASIPLSGAASIDFDEVEWLRVTRGERPDLAARLANAGFSPADADLRLDKLGMADPTARPVMIQVIHGLPIDAAVRLVSQYRARTELGG